MTPAVHVTTPIDPHCPRCGSTAGIGTKTIGRLLEIRCYGCRIAITVQLPDEDVVEPYDAA